MGKLLYADLTDKIIGAAFKVHNTLGSDLTEHAYKNTLTVQLRIMGLMVEVEKELSVIFSNIRIGIQRADILLEEKVIIEVKAVRRISQDHISKLLGTLRNTRYQLGLVINFGKSVQIKRVINSTERK